MTYFQAIHVKVEFFKDLRWTFDKPEPESEPDPPLPLAVIDSSFEARAVVANEAALAVSVVEEDYCGIHRLEFNFVMNFKNCDNAWISIKYQKKLL